MPPMPPMRQFFRAPIPEIEAAGHGNADISGTAWAVAYVFIVF
jgi:hypothetical protein